MAEATETRTGAPAFQDLMPDNACWGCGSANAGGLQLKSYWEGEEAVATWQPRLEHASGSPHVLNGGIIATLLDCHGVCTAVSAAYRRRGPEPGDRAACLVCDSVAPGHLPQTHAP